MNSQDAQQRTPLYVACLKGSKKVMQLLCDNSDVDPLLPDKYGLTPLDLTLANKTWSLLLKQWPDLELSETMQTLVVLIYSLLALIAADKTIIERY